MVDVRTLLIFLAVADLLIAAVLVIGAGRRLQDGLGPWSASLAVRAVALLLFARFEPLGGALPVAAGLLALSLTLQAHALTAFERHSLPAWMHSAAVAGIAIPVALLAGEAASGILFGGLVYGTLLATAAAIAWQVRPPATYRSRGILAG